MPLSSGSQLVRNASPDCRWTADGQSAKLAAVMVVALGVFGTGSGWPDLAVAAVMGVLALTAARAVIQQAWAELPSVPAHA